MTWGDCDMYISNRGMPIFDAIMVGMFLVSVTIILLLMPYTTGPLVVLLWALFGIWVRHQIKKNRRIAEEEERAYRKFYGEPDDDD